MNDFAILEKLNVLNYDDGTSFLVKERLDVVCHLLSQSKYHLISCKGLYHLYAKKPLEQLDENVVVLSTHIDCQKNITKCFSKVLENGLLKGTYDNSITNAAVVSLMLEDRLPDNVVVAFTGDEEVYGRGAITLTSYLKQYQKQYRAIVLDVTGMAWEEADFTVENDCWNETFGKVVVEAAIQTTYQWKFISLHPQNIPDYVPTDVVIPVKAQLDEAWLYAENGIPSFSFCIPVEGNMHCNDGVLASQQSFYHYMESLETIAKRIVK